MTTKMGAPKVLAKGAGVLAQRIKEIGEEHRILQLEAPLLLVRYTAMRR